MTKEYRKQPKKAKKNCNWEQPGQALLRRSCPGRGDGFQISADSGPILENIVFSELKRRGCEIYYWKDKNGKEVDFLIRQGQEITAALQVCQDIDTNETRKREISGALAAVAAFGLTEAKILTADREGEEIHNGVRILYKPV